MSAQESPPHEFNTEYEIFIAALSLLSLVNIVLESLLRFPATRNVIYAVDAVLSIVFIIDFLVRLWRAPARADYFFRQYGWADLLGSLPFLHFKILRIFRLIRVIRLLRRHGTRAIVRRLVRDRAGSALLTLLFIAILVLEFGSVAMLRLEHRAHNANITTASDAIWYLIATMSTVGYGDRYPVTTGGRELGAFVIVVGVGIFGTLTGFLANLFLSPRKRPAADAPTSLTDARHRLQQLKQLLDEQQATVADLEHMLTRDDK
jgi:voltage-gated potassium channel